LSGVLASDSEQIKTIVATLPEPLKNNGVNALKELRLKNVIVRQKFRCFITTPLSDGRKVILTEKRVPADKLTFGWNAGQYHLDKAKVTMYSTKRDPIIVYDEKYFEPLDSTATLEKLEAHFSRNADNILKGHFVGQTVGSTRKKQGGNSNAMLYIIAIAAFAVGAFMGAGPLFQYLH